MFVLSDSWTTSIVYSCSTPASDLATSFKLLPSASTGKFTFSLIDPVCSVPSYSNIVYSLSGNTYNSKSCFSLSTRNV